MLHMARNCWVLVLGCCVSHLTMKVEIINFIQNINISSIAQERKQVFNVDSSNMQLDRYVFLIVY